MDTLNELLGGFAAAMTWQNLIFAFLGCLLGTIIGVLPGVGPVAGVALLIPLTLNLDPTGSIIMLCAIFYGTQYGGTITSVLLNTPGEASSAITTIDGYAMTKLGRAGAALTIAAVGSFVGGTIATIGLVAAAKPLGELGLLVGPPEFFALMVVGISLLVALAGKSMVKALISGALGLLISMVGIDPVAGAPRFTFGMDRLLDGVSFVAVIVGVFGLSEILSHRKDAETPLVHAPGLPLTAPHPDGMAPQRPRHGPRHRRRLRTRPHSRHDRIRVVPAVLRARKRSFPASATNSARVQSKAWPVRKQPTTPTPMPP